jgi:DNA-binding NtrC family response regulator
MVQNLHVQTRREPAARPDSGGLNALQGRVANEVFGDSEVMQQLQRQMAQAAASEANLLIAGERGTGRRLVARTIHSSSGNASAPLVFATCSDGVEGVFDAIETLELLTRGGPAHHHQQGTLVLDGITDLSPTAQLEVATRLGMTSGRRESNGHAQAHPRVIATIEGDLKDAVAVALLHPELASTLSDTQIRVPTLRERGDDIESLAQYFLALLNSEHEAAKNFSGASLKLLRDHTWPGNVRELRAAVQRAFLAADLELDLRSAVDATVAEPASLRIVVGTSLADAERRMIAATLRKCNGNKTRAAALLGVSLKTLYNRLNAYRAEGVDLNSVDRDVTEVTS